jgi:hypothetical protein
MKMILVFLTFVFAVASMPAFAEIGPINRSTNVDYAGAVVSGTLEQRFINVINSSGASIAAGKAVTLDLSADNGASVTVLTTAGLSPLCVMVSSCAIAALCKCQTYGYMSTGLFGNGIVNAVAGSPWYMSATVAGYIAARTTPLATEVAGGIFYDAATATGAMEIFINL